MSSSAVVAERSPAWSGPRHTAYASISGPPPHGQGPETPAPKAAAHDLAARWASRAGQGARAAAGSTSRGAGQSGGQQPDERGGVADPTREGSVDGVVERHPQGTDRQLLGRALVRVRSRDLVKAPGQEDAHRLGEGAG